MRLAHGLPPLMAIEFRTMKPIWGLREPLSGISHFAGFLLSIAGLIWLIQSALASGKILHLFAFSLFGVSLVLLYLSSTVYHSINAHEKHITWLKRIDHMMIFVLIAGTYTPICLIAIGGLKGWLYFSAIWFLAALGMLCKVFWLGMPRWGYVLIYLVMSWLGVLLLPAVNPLIKQALVFWLGTGGLFYSFGAVIYALKWPNFSAGIWEFHETWHLFVLGGSACHFVAIQICARI